MIVGNAVVYSLSMPTRQAGNISIVLAGVLLGGPRQYYLVSERLTLGQTVGDNYTYTLEDALTNVSGPQAVLEPGIVSGKGALVNSIYSYTLRGTGYLVFPFEYTPKISVAYRHSAITLSVNATLTTSPAAKTLFKSNLDTVTIDSNYDRPVFTVGGSNPVGQNLVEMVLTSQGSSNIRVDGLDSYLQLFYLQWGELRPAPEAASQGAYVQGVVVGANAYPVYNSTAPLVILSSTINGFQTLWPLNTRQLSLTLDRPAVLSVNQTTVWLGRGSYSIPVNNGDQLLAESLGLDPVGGASQTVALSAPQTVSIKAGVRGLFTGWNNTYRSTSLRFNLTKPTYLKPMYQAQDLVSTYYDNQRNMTTIGTQYYWVNYSTAVDIRFPSTVYGGKYVRYVFVELYHNGTYTNQSSLVLNVDSPTAVYGLYQLQFLVAFEGTHAAEYSKLDVWVDAYTRVNLTLPEYILDGEYERLVFQNYTLGNTTHVNRTLGFYASKPLNITLNYVQQYEVNFTGPYSQYYYPLSGWYNEDQNYSVNIPRTLDVNSTFRILYDYAYIGENVTTNYTTISGTIHAPVILELHLTPEYYVVISAPNTHLKGFYNKGTTIMVQADYYSGSLIELKVFQEWVGTVNTTDPLLQVTVNQPIHEYASYTSIYIRLLLLLAIMATSIIITIITLATRRNKHRL
jgi:hypothetical protein